MSWAWGSSTSARPSTYANRCSRCSLSLVWGAEEADQTVGQRHIPPFHKRCTIGADSETVWPNPAPQDHQTFRYLSLIRSGLNQSYDQSQIITYTTPLLHHCTSDIPAPWYMCIVHIYIFYFQILCCEAVAAVTCSFPSGAYKVVRLSIQLCVCVCVWSASKLQI